MSLGSAFESLGSAFERFFGPDYNLAKKMDPADSHSLRKALASQGELFGQLDHALQEVIHCLCSL